MSSEQPAPQKGKMFDVTGLPWWQTVLAVAPIALVFVGGLVGGACGAAAALANIRIAKSGLPVGIKELAMIGVDAAAVVVWLIVATVLVSAFR